MAVIILDQSVSYDVIPHRLLMVKAEYTGAQQSNIGIIHQLFITMMANLSNWMVSNLRSFILDKSTLYMDLL